MKPSNKIHRDVLLFFGLAEKKKDRKSFLEFWEEVCSENLGESRKEKEQQQWSGEERGGYDHAHTRKEVQCDYTGELLPLFSQEGRGRGEGASAGCLGLRVVLFKSWIPQGERHFHLRLKNKTPYLNPNTPGQPSAIAFASQENVR